jgi:hypothetical protein
MFTHPRHEPNLATPCHYLSNNRPFTVPVVSTIQTEEEGMSPCTPRAYGRGSAGTDPHVLNFITRRM